MYTEPHRYQWIIKECKELCAYCIEAIVIPTFDLYEEGNSDTLDYTIKTPKGAFNGHSD